MRVQRIGQGHARARTLHICIYIYICTFILIDPHLGFTMIFLAIDLGLQATWSARSLAQVSRPVGELIRFGLCFGV